MASAVKRPEPSMTLLVDEPAVIERRGDLFYISVSSGEYRLPTIVMRRSIFYKCTRRAMALVEDGD